ncbi:MAG: polysaccharide deacetylase family protein [Hyphomicrobiaceae bacterium]|nr:polysaccharide deacetylase family protein [Hyphomicrobiaceae bacterium]
MMLRDFAAALVFGMTSASIAAAPVLAETNRTCDPKKTLGVERVVEIDSANGPRIGQVQYKAIDFLEPGEVVLTFDDGPSRQTTPAVLDALSAHCTKATFFMVGRMAISDPEMVRKVDALGHTVASHTWSHKNLARQSSQQAEREVELGISAITAALGKPIAPFFRFPYLSDPRRVISHLEERNQAILSIDVDSYDWRARSRSIMFNNVLSQLKSRGKGIILFHDIQRVTATNISALLDELKERGYKVVHLVPKNTAATIASYDRIAGEMLAKREVAAAAKPLTTRSMVWPISGKEPAETVVRPPEQESLPWTKTANGREAKDSRPNESRVTSAAPQPARTPAARPAQQPRRSEPTLMELMFGPQFR